MAVLLLSACQPTAPETPVLLDSAWGTVITVAQAEQADAPAIWPTSAGIVAAWVDTEANEPPFQALRSLTPDRIGEPVKLPLPVRPSAQQLITAGGDNLHLFWLDANVDNETRLFTALIKPDLSRERESTILTEQSTRRYALLPAGDGGVWAIAAGGLVSEPSLYAHFIDFAGRPRFEDVYEIVYDADWPTGLRANDGSLTLFWLRKTDGQVMRSAFANGQLLDPHPINFGVLLNPGDRLESFCAAQDNTRQYLFWNITRMNGSRETWMASGGSKEIFWADARPLGISVDPTDIDLATPQASTFKPGFNAGVSLPAAAGHFALSWAQPITEQFNTLPVAALAADSALTIVYFRGGEIVGVQPLNINAQLIGIPKLQVDRDLFLYLAWSQPTVEGYANLQLVTLKYRDWESVKTLRQH
ncbi:MAG: hypothetical protein R3E39_10795 [Anaerolineae bacterium]